jgi:hypothetical protein
MAQLFHSVCAGCSGREWIELGRALFLKRDHPLDVVGVARGDILPDDFAVEMLA